LLARGALAFIGHVELAWGYSFMPAEASTGLAPVEAFQRALRHILAGEPVGFALRDQHDRGVHLSSSLLEALARERVQAKRDPIRLAYLWTERNDARAYIVIGDPAARVRLDVPRMDKRRGISDDAQVTTPPASTPPAEPPPSGYESFLPLPTSDGVDDELLEAWKAHMKSGFKHNDEMFRRVLSAMIVPYWLTVCAYVALFLFGLVGFAVAAWLAVAQQLAFASIFGGLSVAAFLTFFISRPLRSLEANIVFVTWLGLIYNTYWTQLMNLTDKATIRHDLEAVSNQAIQELTVLASHQQNRKSQPD
jgi:hypothetical protein